MRIFNILIITTALMISTSAKACWEEAANKYGINAYLLYAIAKTESNLNPRAFNRNKNGSVDIGLMQINSSWLPTLGKYGVTESGLYDACTSIHVGAWILAQNIRRYGNTWEAVGAYNARSSELRIRYAMKVYRNLPLPLRGVTTSTAQSTEQLTAESAAESTADIGLASNMDSN
jgi:soluble lytic murein transglycosylase-like protein